LSCFMAIDGGLAWLRGSLRWPRFFVLAVGKNGLTPAKTTEFPIFSSWRIRRGNAHRRPIQPPSHHHTRHRRHLRRRRRLRPEEAFAGIMAAAAQ
jgi:hypothetical protein